MFDRLFRRFGLSGKSVIPFIVSSGCAVPAINLTKTIENEDERKIAIYTTSFVPCSAKLPIIALFAGSFFGPLGSLISLIFYVMGIALIFISSIFLHKFFFKKAGLGTMYVLELPTYKLPTASYVFKSVLSKTWAFIKKAGTIIVLCSLIVWFLASFTFKFQYVVDSEDLSIDDSMLAYIGRAFAWLFYPMLGGVYSWGATVSAIQGIVAKEQVVSSMSVIAGLAGDETNAIFEGGIFSFFTGYRAFAFLTFNLFCPPCFAAIGSAKKELVSGKRLAGGLAYQFGLAWTLATLIGLVGWGIESLIAL
jgi:ferrous iron transport protein B